MYKLGLNGHRPAKKPFISEANRRKRVTWCKTWKTFDFSSVLYTDEKKWVFHKSRKAWVWRPVGQRFHPRYCVTTKQQGGGSLMVLGAISIDRAYPLIKVEGTLTGEGYVNILQQFFPPAPSSSRATHRPLLWTIQQDNASAHTSRVAEAYLKRRRAEILPWPPNSPDLSPIENLWSIVSQKVHRSGKVFRTADELFAEVQKEWLATPP